MSAGIAGVFGRPGYRTAQGFQHRFIFRDGVCGFWPGGGNINTTKTRDVMPGSENAAFLRPGLFMGKITSSGLWANSFFGVSTGAITGASTEISFSAAQAAELVRRNGGSTGTFNLIGPATANGTARTVLVTFSAVDTVTGAVTITAIGVAAVWTLTAAAGTDGGSYRLKVTTPDGVSAITGNLAWNANTATVDAAVEALANVGAGNVVAVYDGGTETLTLTFGAALGAVRVEVVNDTTSDGGVFEGGWAVVNTTVGVDGRFVAGSLLAANDGSQVPLTLIGEGYGLLLFVDSNNAPSVNEFPQIPVFGTIQTTQLYYWPSDTGLKNYIKNSLSTTAGAKFIFSDVF